MNITTLQAIKLAASADFRPMSREDFRAFADAPEGSLIAEAGEAGEWLIISMPETSEEGGALEFIYTSADDEIESFRLVIEQL